MHLNWLAGLINRVFTNSVNLPEQAVAPTAAVATLALHAMGPKGRTALQATDNVGFMWEFGEDTYYTGKNTTGSPITKGQVVYVNGSSGNVPTIALARANSTTTIQAVSVAAENIANGGFGHCFISGVIENINTNAWAPGTLLFVDPTTPGALTSTYPNVPNYAKKIAEVIVQGVGNGSLLVRIDATFGKETGTNNPFEFAQSAKFDTYADFVAQGSNPPAPPAGVVRFHSATTQGFTRFEQDNEAATNIILGRDNVFIAKNTTVSTITHGSPVYVTGTTGNVPNIGLAKADSSTTLPAIGIALDSINANAFGQVMLVGIHQPHDTSAWSTGDQLWVSPTVAGTLTNVRPTYPNLVQRIGSVLVSGVGNGSMLIDVAPFIGGLEQALGGYSAASFFAFSAANG